MKHLTVSQGLRSDTTEDWQGLRQLRLIPVIDLVLQLKQLFEAHADAARTSLDDNARVLKLFVLRSWREVRVRLRRGSVGNVHVQSIPLDGIRKLPAHSLVSIHNFLRLHVHRALFDVDRTRIIVRFLSRHVVHTQLYAPQLSFHGLKSRTV